MYTNASAFLTPRRLQLLLSTNDYMLQLLSHDDAEHVSDKMYFVIFIRALPPILCHHWCGSKLAFRISRASTGLYGPRRSSYSVNSAIASSNRTPRTTLILCPTLFSACFVSPFSCISITFFRYKFNNEPV
jgi:hypothetical protein